MSFTFRPATRENVSMLISLAGGTGSGKTYSAMELATGLSGGKPFAVIDTEAGRACHYADRFRFDHGDLKAPFRPDAYTDAISAADAAGYPVIIVDSASHEHAGEGGLLDWHDEELDRIAGDDWKKREACTMVAWAKVKTSHKRFVQRMLQLRAHLILCFRAEPKVEIARENGKTVIRPKTVNPSVGFDGWLPVCEKSLPFEMTMSFMLMSEHPGVGLPIKLQEQHRQVIDLSKPIGRSFGEAIAKWAKGGVQKNHPEAANIADVLAGIECADTIDELDAVKAQGAKLGQADKAKAVEAFRRRRSEIEKADGHSTGETQDA